MTVLKLTTLLSTEPSGNENKYSLILKRLLLHNVVHKIFTFKPFTPLTDLLSFYCILIHHVYHSKFVNGDELVQSSAAISHARIVALIYKG